MVSGVLFSACVNVACVALHLASFRACHQPVLTAPPASFRPGPMTNAGLLCLIRPSRSASARTRENKNGASPARTQYKIRCENRGCARPRQRLRKPSGPSTVYLRPPAEALPLSQRPVASGSTTELVSRTAACEPSFPSIRQSKPLHGGTKKLKRSTSC